MIDELRISDAVLSPSEFRSALAPSAFPEPTSLTLAILGYCTLAVLRRKRWSR